MSETPRERDVLTQAMRDLSGDIRDFRGELRDLRHEIHSDFVRKEVYLRDLAEVKGDVKNNSDWIQWGQRIVIGLVLVGLVGLVIVRGGEVPL